MTTLRRELKQKIYDTICETGFLRNVQVSGADAEYMVEKIADAILEIRAFAKLESEIELREKLPAGIDAAIAAGRKVEEGDLNPQSTEHYTAIIDYLNHRLSINLDKYGENRRLDKVIRDIHKDGQSVSAFCDWVVSKGVDVTWYTRVPENIWRDWPQAFVETKSKSPTFVPEEKHAVPHPFQKPAILRRPHPADSTEGE